MISACGGGSSSSSPATANPVTPGTSNNPVVTTTAIKGTAATGAPLANAKITVRGAITGEVNVDAATDGSYSLTDAQQASLSGIPYLVQACGTTDAGLYLCLYSASNEISVINVTPLTHAALALTVKDDPTTIFNNRTAVDWALFSTKLDFFSTALTAYVQKLGLTGGAAGLVKKSFTANHTGLDAMLDAVKVVTDTMEAGRVSVSLINRANTSEFLVIADTATSVLPNKISSTNAPILSGAGEHADRLNGFKAAVNAAMAKVQAGDESGCQTDMRAITASDAVINAANFCPNATPVNSLKIVTCQNNLCRVSFDGDGVGTTLLNDNGVFKFSGRAIDVNDCVGQVRWEANRNFWLDDNSSQIQRAVNVQVRTSCATAATLSIASAIVSIPNASGGWDEFYRLKKGCAEAQNLDLLDSTNFDGSTNPNGACGNKQFNKLDGKRFGGSLADSSNGQIDKVEALVAKIKANGAAFQIKLYSDDAFGSLVATVVKPIGGYIASWANIERLPWPALTDASLASFKNYNPTSNFSAQFKAGSSYLQSADIRNENMDKRGAGIVPGKATSGTLQPHTNWGSTERLLLQINAQDSEGGQLQTNYHLSK